MPATQASATSTITVKEEPLIGIKPEPLDDDDHWLRHQNYDDLTPTEMISDLAATLDTPITVCNTIERDMMSSCCDLPIELGEPILTTYKRGRHDFPSFEGKPTCFATTLDANGNERQGKKRGARFYHTNGACLEEAMSDSSEMWMVKRDQKTDFPIPRGRESCKTCGDNTSLGVIHETTQMRIGTEGPTHVFCARGDCMRTWYDSVMETCPDRKNFEGKEKVTYISAKVPVQFRMVCQESLEQICDFTGEDRITVVQGLLDRDDGETAWL